MTTESKLGSSATHVDAIVAKFRPLGDVVLARVEEAHDTQTPGGIFIPDAYRGRPKHAVVLALHGGDTPLRVGMRIVFDPLRIERVLTDDPTANADGSPLARHGDAFLIREPNVLAYYQHEGPSRSQAIAACEVLEAYGDVNGGSHMAAVAAIRKALWA